MVFAARLAVVALNHADRLRLAVADKDGKPVPGVAVVELPTNKSALPKASRPNKAAVTQGGKLFIPLVFTVGRGHQNQMGQQRPHQPSPKKFRLRTWIRSTPPGLALKSWWKARLMANRQASRLHSGWPWRGGSQRRRLLDRRLGARLFLCQRRTWTPKTGAHGLVSFKNLLDGMARIKVWQPD